MDSKEIIIAHYMDGEGMVTKDRDPGPWTTGNGLMHVGLFMCFLYILKLLTEVDILRFYNTVKLCEDGSGIYDRNKGRNDKNAHDDAAGVVSGSAVSKLMFHKDVLQRGLSDGFIYNNVNPNVFVDDINPLKWEWWALRIRLPHHILWYFLVNGRLLFLSPILMLYIWISGTGRPPHYSHLLNYQILESMCAVSKFWKKCRSFLLKRIKLVESTAAYFGEHHELVNMAKEVMKTV